MNTIADLRRHLFSALEGLTDVTTPIPVERAKAIADVAQVVINSAKVEVEFIKATKGKGTGFIVDSPTEAPALPEAGPAGEKGSSPPSWPSVPVNGILSITQHVMKD